MRKQIKFILLILVVALVFSGCVSAVDQMYCIPKRLYPGEQLQTVIDKAMADLNYCAPLSGNNMQAVQQADLDGDGEDEFLLFASGTSNSPLRLLILKENAGAVTHVETITCVGSAFDFVIYAEMDENPGCEIIFGSQISDQLQGMVHVYSFDEALACNLLLSTSYTECLTADLDKDNKEELLLLKSDENNGIIQSYKQKDGQFVCASEAEISGPLNKVERVLIGNVYKDIPALFVTTTADEATAITDVYVHRKGRLTNVAISSDDSVGIKTLRNGFTYVTDIDNDGVMELPYTMPMMPMGDHVTDDKRCLIRWYALTDAGESMNKAFTFHNYVDNWYLELNDEWASRLTVVSQNTEHVFYIWDDSFEQATKIMTMFSRYNKGEQLNSGADQYKVFANDLITYTAKFEDEAAVFGMTPEYVADSFHIIN